MTTYYISPNGSDANNGLGPDASHSTNKPYLTLGKAMNTGSAVVPGDTVYIAPGYYYSASCTPISGICSAGSPTSFIGDPTNKQGFKDGSGVRLAPGIPWVTTRTSGEGIDGAPASASNLFTLTTNTPSGLTFRYLGLESKNGTYLFVMSWAGSTDITVQDCVVGTADSIFRFSTGAPTAARNITLQRCVVYGTSLMNITAAASATDDADLAIAFRNNLFYEVSSNTAGNISLGASAHNAGGIVYYNTWIAKFFTISTTASNVSTATPIKFGSNVFITGQANAFITSGTAGQIIDDGYNRIIGNGAFSGVTPAATTVFSALPNLVGPHLVSWGLEMPRSDFLGWTDAAATTQKFSASGIVTADFRGRTIRPWGAGASIGCWQAQDVVQDTASAITGGGTNSLKLTGAGEVSLYIPVDATGFTVSVRTKSTSYGGTSYPQMIVVANPGVGVTTDTTVTAAAATEETITAATITPTSKGVMEVRLISRSTSVSSTTHFDILTSA
jgi:hypothetical protein